MRRFIRKIEYNHSSEDNVHFLQVWLLPDEKGLTPAYQQKNFPVADRQNVLLLVVSRNGPDGSLIVRQDASIYVGALDAGQSVIHYLAERRHAWVQLARGRYAEFATMIPASGSAHTYAYVVIGELVAWIIGWGLILEY